MSLAALGLSAAGAGGATLVDGVSLAIQPGELVALLGPNGAGKTSLLRALSGELPRAAGEILLEDRPLAGWAPRERAARIGVLPQSSRLAFPFTALEVALLGRTPHVARRESARDTEIARLALQRAGAGRLAPRDYLALSGGERQCVHLARVLAQVWDAPPHGARYLLLDEPTASLDLRLQHALLALARQLAGQGFGLLVALHDLNLAAQYATRAALLCGGRLLAQGPPRQVLSAERVGRVWGVAATAGADPRTGRWTVGCGPEHPGEGHPPAEGGASACV
ncbi:MAG TPA: heme ABC transporter ATP-binding protein, partial [Planctomycetota bacterium]|nr:heme ABC transporter ATP-binding protein [Planctomycetota bacterium]